MIKFFFRLDEKYRSEHSRMSQRHGRQPKGGRIDPSLPYYSRQTIPKEYLSVLREDEEDDEYIFFS